MLELCSGLRALPSRLAVDIDMIAGFRSGTATLGCGVAALGFSGNLEAENHLDQFGFTTSALHSRIGNEQTCKIGASYIASGSYLESTLAQNRGRGAATLTSPLSTPEYLSLAESYRCTQNKSNSFGLISLQKKVGGHPRPEVIL